LSEPAGASYLPSGRVTLATLMTLRRAGEAAIAEAEDEVEFDLSGVENGNSAGVALLIAWFREAERLDKRIVFRHVPEDLLNIVDLSGLTPVLPLRNGHGGETPAGAGR
jgi:phospholipid transport system transporter-binding protein